MAFKKDVYVLSSEHYASTGVLNCEHILRGEVLEVRLGLLEMIGRNITRGAFFSDGLLASMVYQANNLFSYAAKAYSDFPNDCKSDATIDEMVSLALLENNDDLFMSEPALYDMSRMEAILLKLRLKGHRIDIKATEENVNENVFTRDKVMFNNLQKYGVAENILFVGYMHPLLDLSFSEKFNVYRVEIRQTIPQRIRVYGKLPARMEKDHDLFLGAMSTRPHLRLSSRIKFADLD
jgi:hypothetical protein